MYQFAGFFAISDTPEPVTLPAGAVWRPVTSPFVGVGVRLPAWIRQSPSPEQVWAQLEALGLHTAPRWVYLTYDCWGGRLDFVYGLGAREGVLFGPLEESGSPEAATAVYTRLMAEFGIPSEAALRFAPFERGFWGDA